MLRYQQKSRPEIGFRDLLELGLTKEESKRNGFDQQICSLYNEFCYDCPQYLCEMRRF
jgi:hypothetical protein